MVVDEDEKMFTTTADGAETIKTMPEAPGKATFTFTEEEVENYRMYIDLLQKQLQKAKETIKANAIELSKIADLERERDRFRAVGHSHSMARALVGPDHDDDDRGCSAAD